MFLRGKDVVRSQIIAYRRRDGSALGGVRDWCGKLGNAQGEYRYLLSEGGFGTAKGDPRDR